MFTVEKNTFKVEGSSTIEGLTIKYALEVHNGVVSNQSRATLFDSEGMHHGDITTLDGKTPQFNAHTPEGCDHGAVINHVWANLQAAYATPEQLILTETPTE